MKSTTDQSFYRISVVSKGGGGRRGGMRGRDEREGRVGWGWVGGSKKSYTVKRGTTDL